MANFGCAQSICPLGSEIWVSKMWYLKFKRLKLWVLLNCECLFTSRTADYGVHISAHGLGTLECSWTGEWMLNIIVNIARALLTYALVSPQGLCENTHSHKVLDEKHSAMKADTSAFSESQSLTKTFALRSRLCNKWALVTFLFNPVQELSVNRGLGTWYVVSAWYVLYGIGTTHDQQANLLNIGNTSTWVHNLGTGKTGIATEAAFPTCILI